MNFLKELFFNIEALILNFFYIDFKITFFYTFILACIYILHINILRRNMKKKLAQSSDFKKLNIETSYQARKKDLIVIYISILILLTFTTIFKENMHIFLPVISGILIILIFSLKEQLNNIFLGLLFKSSFKTTIHEGMLFYFKDRPNEPFELVKINALKSIIKNEKTGILESIEHKEINSLMMIHKPLNSLDYVTFTYLVGQKFDVIKYKEQVEKVFESFKTEVDYTGIKKEVISIKERFKVAPYLKPSYYISVKYNTKIEMEIKVIFSIYNYNYNSYLEDFVKLKPKA